MNQHNANEDTMKRLLISLSLALALTMLSACESDPGPEEPEAQSPPVAMEDAMNSEDTAATPLQAAIAAAKADLAGRIEIDSQDIEVDLAREVTWRDGALGCPEPDMMYTQALVPGYYIRLRAGKEAYAYHAGRDGQPFPCPADRSQRPADEEVPLR
jgi:hypothetical protein